MTTVALCLRRHKANDGDLLMTAFGQLPVMATAALCEWQGCVNVAIVLTGLLS